VTEGAGLIQSRGGLIEPIRAGDTVHFEPNEEHWHGADPENFMTHLAMQEIADDGSDATWGEQVTDAEYAGG
jgi:quercetin dioxygenase-like cupin family protein